MGGRLPVYVYARDHITQSGTTAQLRSRPEIEVVDEVDIDASSVTVVAADETDEETVRVIRAIQRNGCPRVVLVVAKLDDAGLLAAVEAGVCGLIRRAEATAERLVATVQAAAAGDGTMPPDLLGRLLTHMGRLQRDVLGPKGFRFSGLTDREIEVLKLVADGLSTTEIARRLSYSDRTIKNVIQDVTTRFDLKNRSHAVAYAMRLGVI
jgi:DNA-binding NarL/FixJ family response regulator